MKKAILPLLCLAAAAPGVLADLTPRDSAQFEYKYEMIKSPSAEDIDGGGAVAAFLGFGFRM